MRPECGLSAADASSTRLGHELIRRGVFVLPGAKMYLSLAHSDEDLATTRDGPVAARRSGR